MSVPHLGTLALHERHQHQQRQSADTTKIAAAVSAFLDLPRVMKELERSVGAGIKAALGEGPKALKEGKVTATVNLTWESTTKLVITTPSEIYIAGQFRKFGYGTSPAADGTLDAAASLGRTLVRSGG